ncbi:MAG: pantoate--beta-alanine ligase [Desulfarculaceae bacterium]|nr:pantoate--beta-alanine ligase [Desulfarculaceae bacterium]
MEAFSTISGIRKWVRSARAANETVCLVPTMGYFHEGHLSLMREGRKLCDRVVVSIFVNPAQFGENEDLDAYPVDLERDKSLARAEGVDAVFVPSSDQMYPKEFQTYVELTRIPGHLCGLSRPGHFKGVATVVAKLFHIVEPDRAVFGSKDYQQLLLIRRMAEDLNFDIIIDGAPIVREEDGLAMSSRNTYLTEQERRSALSLSRSLDLAAEMIDRGEKDPGKLAREMERLILSHPGTRIDYVKPCDPETLEKVEAIRGPLLVALAVRIGRTRLIDNRIFHPER